MPDHDQLCFLASAKKINPIEWRFWIFNNQIITYTPYTWDEEFLILPKDCPLPILAQAEKLAKSNFSPDLIYCADFVLYENDGYLIEVNAASTSGVYEADLSKILIAMKNAIIFENESLNC